MCMNRNLVSMSCHDLSCIVLYHVSELTACIHTGYSQLDTASDSLMTDDSRHQAAQPLRASLPLQPLATSCLPGALHDQRSQDLLSSNAAMSQALTSRVMQRSSCDH